MKLTSITMFSLAMAFGAGCSTDDTTADAGSAPVEATFTSLYGDYFSNCKGCHSPSGAGRTSDTEQTLNFTNRTTALSTLKTGMASGLVGNFTGCNGVSFIASTPGSSLVVAVLDQPTRQAIDLSGHPDCDSSSIPDMTAKVGHAPSGQFVAALKTWITDGAMDN
jgi:hypothetical protein